MTYDIMYKYPGQPVEAVEEDLDKKTANSYLSEYRMEHGEGRYYVRQHQKERRQIQ
jgi:hypothetical protein